ncbi:MAG: hypothetical protein AAGI34_12800 [Pseudomonadota bacterium]
MHTARAITALLVRLLRKLGRGMVLVGGLMLAIVVVAGAELSTPKQSLALAAGMVLLGVLAVSAALLVERGSLWASLPLVLIGVVLSPFALIIDLPTPAQALPPSGTLALRFALILVWWALTVTAIMVCWQGRSAAGTPQVQGTR